MDNCTCKIQWIDDNGCPTPDTNPAIGRARTMPGNRQVINGVIHVFEASEWFPICEDHARELSNPGMHIWEFVRFAP